MSQYGLPARGEQYDSTSSRTGPLWPKKWKKIDLKDAAKK